MASYPASQPGKRGVDLSMLQLVARRTPVGKEVNPIILDCTITQLAILSISSFNFKKLSTLLQKKKKNSSQGCKIKTLQLEIKNTNCHHYINFAASYKAG